MMNQCQGIDLGKTGALKLFVRSWMIVIEDWAIILEETGI
jgi:hypothetical protein